MLRASRSFLLLFVSLLLLSACTIQPIQPQPPAAAPAPAEAVAPAGDTLTDEEVAALAVVEAYAEVGSSHPMTADNLDEYLAFYADDAIMLSLPSNSPANEGKAAIRDYYLTHDVHDRAFFEFEVLHVDGPMIFAHYRTHGDFTGQLPSGGIYGLEVFVIKDGKIAEDYSAMTPDSSAELYGMVGPQTWGGPVSEIPAQFAAVGDATRPWAGTPSADTVDASLAAYPDDVVLTLLVAPGTPQDFEGKAALRALMEQWAADGTRIEFTPIARDDAILGGRARIWDAELEALGIAPLEAIDAYTVSDGVITHQWRVITPDSLMALLAAQGVTP